MNLLSCDKEPIHIPGRIQSHGFLVAFSPDTGLIHYFSENISSVAQADQATIPGQDFWQFLTSISHTSAVEAKTHLTEAVAHNFSMKDSLVVELRTGKRYYLVFCASDDLIIAEFEEVPDAAGVDLENADSFSRILSFDTISEGSDFLCSEIRRFSGFDRVMVYQFDEDYHGEVVAESGQLFSHSLMHHHFPASDIPAQARQLYLLNRMRLIRDVDDPGAAIIAGNNQQKPLDLTWCMLRSVSPVHIRYLKNMNVRASYSISIVHEEKLWGLVTCHNRAPHHLPLRTRNFCKTITDIFSANLANLYTIATNRQADRFSVELADTTTQVILTGDSRCVIDNKLNDATGAAYVHGKSVSTSGAVPSDSAILEIADMVIARKKDIFHTDSIGSVMPSISKEDEKKASGLLALLISEQGREVLMWFKPEVQSTIKWAGNPEDIYRDFESLDVLNPRHSFETWSQTFTGRSEGWNSGELRTADILSREILKINQERSDAIRQLHDKLQQAYEELSAFSYTVSHDLKAPLTAVKNYAQLLVMKESLSATGEVFTSRIISSANKMHAFIDDLFSYTRIGYSEPVWVDVDVRELLDSILEDYRAVYGEKFEIRFGELPVIRSDKTLLYQVFSNLVGNAIKYSMARERPLVVISGEENDDEVHFVIADNGIGMPEGETKHLFTRFYRLSNARLFEGTGLGLAITKRIMDKLGGNISIQSRENEGTECRIIFPKTSRR